MTVAQDHAVPDVYSLDADQIAAASVPFPRHAAAREASHDRRQLEGSSTASALAAYALRRRLEE